MEVSILQLWIPILVGTGLAWIASGLIHMVIKYHNSDYQGVPNEEAFRSASRPFAAERKKWVCISFRIAVT